MPHPTLAQGEGMNSYSQVKSADQGSNAESPPKEMQSLEQFMKENPSSPESRPREMTGSEPRFDQGLQGNISAILPPPQESEDIEQPLEEEKQGLEESKSKEIVGNEQPLEQFLQENPSSPEPQVDTDREVVLPQEPSPHLFPADEPPAEVPDAPSEYLTEHEPPLESQEII